MLGAAVVGGWEAMMPTAGDGAAGGERLVRSPGLVGRAGELAMLRQALSRAPAVVLVEGEARGGVRGRGGGGRGGDRARLGRARSRAQGVVVVEGEAGVGKSRLVQEFLDT